MTVFIWLFLYIFVALLWGVFTNLVSKRLYSETPEWKAFVGFWFNVILFPISLIMACLRVKQTFEQVENNIHKIYNNPQD